MRKTQSAPLVAVLVLTAIGWIAWGDDGEMEEKCVTGVEGILLASDGSSLARVAVELHLHDSKEPLRAISDRDGRFTICMEGTGRHDLVVKLIGFKTMTLPIEVGICTPPARNDIALPDHLGVLA